MSQKISFDVDFVSGPAQWYNQVAVKNIKRGDDYLKVQKYLVVTFKEPTTSAPTQFWGGDISVAITSILSAQSVDPSVFLVTAILEFAQPYQFNEKSALNFGINGDMTKGPDAWTKSFHLAADPAGKVQIHCAPAPDKGLVGVQQLLTFTQGSLVIPTSVIPGTTSSFAVLPGKYKVTAPELANQDETVVATPHLSPDSITVHEGTTADLKVTYNNPVYYSAIDVTIGDVAHLQKELFHVKVANSDKTFYEFWSPANHTSKLRRLPSTGTIVVTVNTTVNNVQYSFKPWTIDASAKLFKHTFQTVDKTEPVSIPGVELPIVVSTANPVDAKFTVRLIGQSPTWLIYKQDVEAKAETINFPVPVAPGKYTVQAPGFIHDYTVYATKTDSTIAVAKGSKLPLHIVRGANLKVPGFPDFLSFGGITNFGDHNMADFEKACASSIFKYVGNGDGHPSGYMSTDGDAVRVVQYAHDVGQNLNQPVLPVMVAYTINFSGGADHAGILKKLQDDDALAYSFGNLILSLLEANKTYQKSPVDAVGYVINADFIGLCLQKSVSVDTKAHVRKPLERALVRWKEDLEKLGVDTKIPTTIHETLAGYVVAVNWLLRTIAKKLPFKVTFGWQLNVWGIKSLPSTKPQWSDAQWVYYDVDPAGVAHRMIEFIKGVKMYDAPYRPDFLAVDRYERDDFTVESYGNKYCFGPHEWPRFFDFCKAVSFELLVPVMPWQIPSSRTPLISDSVQNIEQQHWGTGGSYILGDAGLNSDYHNANEKILALPINIYDHYKTVKDLFAIQKFDWTYPAYSGFPLQGIFAVSLGGGATTGIVSNIGNAGPFVINRLAAYAKQPISLKNTHD